jgi:hypothetical protein
VVAGANNIDILAKMLLQRFLYADKCSKRWAAQRDDDVNIAIRTRFVPCSRAEETYGFNSKRLLKQWFEARPRCQNYGGAGIGIVSVLLN